MPTTPAQHPVHLHVPRAAHSARLHVLIRLVLLAALGTLGCSSLYWAIYLALPALAALAVSRLGGEAYLRDTAPSITLVLRWLAGAYAYLWMLTDAPPGQGSPVELSVESGGQPTIGSALMRLLKSLPALVVLVVLSCAGALLWLVAALFILVAQRVPAVVADFLELTLRYQFRLVAYHVSLVDRYPSIEPEHVELGGAVGKAVVIALALFLPLSALAKERHLATPPLSSTARALVRLKMANHSKQMTELVWAVVLLDYVDAADTAKAIAAEPRFARPTSEDATELNAALPPRFFALQDQLRQRAHQLEVSARSHDPTGMAKSYGSLAETCVACHDAYLNTR